MDFTVTSTNQTGCRGASLAEMMVACGLGTVVVAAGMALMFFSARSFAAVTNYVDLDSKSRNTLDRMTEEIRQADTVTACDSTHLAFTGSDSVTGTTNTLAYTLTYSYSPSLKTLTRTKSSEGQTQTLLTQCDSLNWCMYQRSLTNGTDQPIPTTDLAQCKLIQLTWICSRKILAKTANTESVQSAEIVIRKK